jgi:hypothetical protein
MGSFGLFCFSSAKPGVSVLSGGERLDVQEGDLPVQQE